MGDEGTGFLKRIGDGLKGRVSGSCDQAVGFLSLIVLQGKSRER